MRFHKVGPDVWRTPVAAAPPRRHSVASRWDGVPHALRRRNRDIVVTFAAAWGLDDRSGMAALTADDMTCRWIGFGGEPETATGLEQVLARGREFERRHGVADRYTVVESMGGTHHAAILFEPDGLDREIRRVARVAVYRIEADRIASIAVYADRLD